MKILIDSYGTEIVFIENEDGTTLSMAKSIYDAQQAQKLTEIATPNETKTK